MAGVNEPNILTEVLPPGKVAYAAGYEPTEEYSAAAEEAILFGAGLKRGTYPEVQVLNWDGAAATDKFVGFALYSTQGTDADDIESPLKGYKKYESVLVLKKGHLWLEIDGDATEPAAGDAVTLYPSNKIGKKLGTAGTSGTYGAQLNGMVKKVVTYDSKKYAIVYFDVVTSPNLIQV